MSTAEPEVHGLIWRKASRSAANGECVEVAKASSFMAIRDSKNPGGGMLKSLPATWRAFLLEMKQGIFNLPG